MLNLIYFVFLISIINFSLGFFVLSRGWQKTLNRIFALFAFITSFWIFNTGILLLNPTLAWGKITISSGFLIGVIFLAFAKFFPRVDRKPTFRFYLLLFLPTLIFFLILPSDLVLKNVAIKDGIPTPFFGPFFPILGIYGVFLIAYGIWLIYRKFKTATGIEKLQIKYIFLGLSLFIGSAFIFGSILPSMGIAKFSFFSPVFSFFLIGFTALAITRYHLFEIKVILTEVLVGVVGFLLLIQIFLLPTPLWKIVSGIIFLLFCIFGYLLIKYTYQQVRQKEILEEKVRERTRELEKRKEELQKAYHEVLSEKEKFERLYKATLGREMMIVKLKEEIKELRKKLEEREGFGKK